MFQVGKVLKSCGLPSYGHFSDSKKSFKFWFCLAQDYFQYHHAQEEQDLDIIKS